MRGDVHGPHRCFRLPAAGERALLRPSCVGLSPDPRHHAAAALRHAGRRPTRDESLDPAVGLAPAARRPPRPAGGGGARREVDAAAVAPVEDAVTVAALGGDAILRVALGDGPELVESDVNGSAASAPAPLAPPFGVTGCIGGPGEEDTYRVTATKGERLRLNASAAAVASPLDVVIRVEDESG